MRTLDIPRGVVGPSRNLAGGFGQQPARQEKQVVGSKLLKGRSFREGKQK